MRTRNALIALLVTAAVTLAGCGERERGLRVGAKNFGESRILAHMMAVLAEQEGLTVEGVVDYPSTQAVLEALKRGDIDVYPDYNGTGLVMLGQNPIADGDAATVRVKELYEPLGLSWRARFGFANNYGLAMQATRAVELDVSSISELVSRAGSLSIGIEDDFEQRPLDGFQPLTSRYGLTFGSVKVVALNDRGQIYDKLLDGEVDVVEVYTTDGQIADYGLVVLEDDLQFFPAYEAAPLARAAALATYPGLAAVLDALGGKISAEDMQDLNRKVEIESRAPRDVARDALARLGLIEGGAVIADDPLLIAASPFLSTGEAASAALRAARSAFRGRDVQIAPTHDPLAAVASGQARLAMLGAESFFDPSSIAPTRDDRFEAVAAIGQTMVHVVTRLDGPTRLDEISTVAVGPDGSSSQRIGAALISGLGLPAEMTNVDTDTAADMVAMVADGGADAAIIVVPPGNRDMTEALASTPGLRLMAISGWSEGANLVRYPFLRQTRIASGVYPSQFGAIDTLGAQLVLAGPAPVAGDAVGDLGPSSVAVSLTPISDAAVRALNGAIAGTVLIDPALRQALALAPALPEPPAAINPSADISILSIVVAAFFIWVIWLYARPEYR
jgi:glycine betaine/choline ABC-type transport system substrate-binding protein